MGNRSSQRTKDNTSLFKVDISSNDQSDISNILYDDSNSCLLAVQFNNKHSITVLKYSCSKDEWTPCHTIPMKGLYRTAIVKNFLCFHDWLQGVRICCYDITTRAIRTVMPLKEDQPYWSCHCLAEFQDCLYLIGADVEDDRRVYCWNPTNDVVTLIPLLITGRTRAACLKHGGYLYVVGGQVGSIGSFRDTNSVERFNPRKNRWELCAPMEVARGVLALASAGYYIYALGGDCRDIPTNIVERYDTRDNQWTQMAPLLVPKCFAGTVYFNSRLMACGSFGTSEDCSIIEEFDETTNKWCRKNNMPTEGPFSYVLATPEWTRQLESLDDV
ncbi:kelch-like protein 1 [Eurosta solidaginis]|uniref:kelch-like protein 1 n=1 Tax=Eurosta solidaginis TaxID=178769 RepID=UPI0035309F14